MKLLEVWGNWQPGSPPFALEDDLEILRRSQHAIVMRRSWKEIPGDTRLHLGLLPQPFFGDLRRASIYILQVNPSVDQSDYHGEYKVPEYRAALLANLRQRRRRKITPFLFLDPQFAWHRGFQWWHSKLAKVIQCLACARKVPYAEARAQLASTLASVELVPYHSLKFQDAGGWLQKLRSVELASSFVRDFVLPRANCGEAIVVVMRQVKTWNLPEHTGVITYTAKEARFAHLAPNTAGGRAILGHLGVQR